MSFPSIPLRPSTDDKGLVKSRIKAFANVVSNTSSSTREPPVLPSKPKNRFSESANSTSSFNLPSAKDIRDMTKTFQTVHKITSTINSSNDGKNLQNDSYSKHDVFETSHIPKLPPPLPKASTIRQSAAPVVNAIKEHDFSVKDIKSKFETAVSAASAVEKFASSNPVLVNNLHKFGSTAINDFQKMNISHDNRKSSQFLESTQALANTAEKVNDFNNNGNIKNIRAQLESKLTMWSPEKGPLHGLMDSRRSGEFSAELDGHVMDNFVHQQRPVSIVQPNNFRKDQFPVSTSCPEGFNTKMAVYEDHGDRPVLPTILPKSKPPPRPPPCSLPTGVSSHHPDQTTFQKPVSGYFEDFSGGLLRGHGESSVQEASAVVLFDFTGEQSDELTSKRGDNLILKHEIDDEWYYAYNTRTSRTGIIPKSFVDVKVPLAEVHHGNAYEDENYAMKKDGPRCYTLHDFVSNLPGDLTFLKGEVIKLISRINTDWLEGESHDGRRGIFPVTFVEIIEDLQEPTSSSANKWSNQVSPKCKNDNIVTALYDFQSENPGDLHFKANTKISVKARVNADWLYGQAIGSGQCGIFPTTFVDHCPEDLPLFDANQKAW